MLAARSQLVYRMRTVLRCIVLSGIVLVLVLVIAAGAQAQQDAGSQTDVSRQAAPSLAGGEPVPVPEPTDKAMRYYHSGNVLWIVGTFWGLLIPALFFFTGFSARIRDWARSLGRKWFFVIALYFVIFSVILFVIDLPLEYYQGYVRQHAYDLSNQTFGKWFGDALKALAVGVIGGVLFLWVPYLLLARSPKRWWLYTGLLMVPFTFFVMLISPIWISPLFNDFGPMQDTTLEARILTLADRAGIEGGRVYEVDKSVDTEAVNAYVTGFMDTKRIVLWDTIIEKLEDDELLFVMGHEMGHYVLSHVIKGVFFYSGVILLALFGVHISAGALIARFKNRLGFDRLADIASLPLLMLLFGVYAIALTPLANGFSRLLEHDADCFGLEIKQPQRRNGIREAAAGEPRQPAAGAPLQALAVDAPDACRPDRLLQQLPAVGDG